MKIIGVIPARYRSSRFPGKPLADICGRPMIWWVYRQAKKVEQLDAVYVATDDERIQTACESYGIPVVMTSPDHPTGSDRVAEVAAKVEGDLFINIQGDEPLMEPEMVRQVIRLFDDPEVYFGSLKKKITDPDLIAADSTVKVVTDDLNNAMYFSRNPIPSGLKDVDKVDVYKHAGFSAEVWRNAPVQPGAGRVRGAAARHAGRLQDALCRDRVREHQRGLPPPSGRGNCGDSPPWAG